MFKIYSQMIQQVCVHVYMFMCKERDKEKRRKFQLLNIDNGYMVYYL